MIEDFLDDPKAELRWFGWALLLLVGLTFAAALVLYGISDPQKPDFLKNPPLVVAGSIVQDAMFGTLIPSSGGDVAPIWSNPLFGLLCFIGLFVARNFLSAFRHHRPHFMAIAGVAPLFYVGLAEIGAPAYAVFAITITAIVWTLLLPIPHSEAEMSQAVRGLAVGLVCAVAFQLGGVLVAAVSAGWMLYARRYIEAAATGIAASLPPLVYVSGSLALDRTDTSAILYGLMLTGVLVEGFAGLLLDSFAPQPEDDPAPDHGRDGLPTDKRPLDEMARDEKPLDDRPVDEVPLDDRPLDEPLFRDRRFDDERGRPDDAGPGRRTP